MTNTITIYDEATGMNPVFVKANSTLITKYSDNLLKIDNANDGLKQLENLWSVEYKATIIKNNDGGWDLLQFKNDSVATMFMLRWE
jgi:hypothetical protein